MVILVACLLMTSCASTANKEINREGQKMVITVTVYSSGDSLIEASRGGHGGLNGEATYSLGDNICDISLKTGGIMEVDGSFAKTLGHEMMHCLYGNYHK